VNPDVVENEFKGLIQAELQKGLPHRIRDGEVFFPEKEANQWIYEKSPTILEAALTGYRKITPKKNLLV